MTRKSTQLLFLAFTGSISLSAGTILSVTGDLPVTTWGLFPNQTLAISFTVGKSYTDVSINPRIIGSFSGTAWLTNQIGSGTAVANLIASNTFTATGLCCDGTFQPVLQNVSIGSGTYFLVLSTTQSSVPQGLQTTPSPVTVADVGASTPFGTYDSSDGFAFAPSDAFFFSPFLGSIGRVTPQFIITGTEVPEPASWLAVSTALAALLCRRKLKFRIPSRHSEGD